MEQMLVQMQNRKRKRSSTCSTISYGSHVQESHPTLDTDKSIAEEVAEDECIIDRCCMEIRSAAPHRLIHLLVQK